MSKFEKLHKTMPLSLIMIQNHCFLCTLKERLIFSLLDYVADPIIVSSTIKKGFPVRIASE